MTGVWTNPSGRASAEVWHVDLDNSQAALSAIERTTPRVPGDDRDRSARLADESERGRRFTAHIALRLLLERAFGSSVRGLPFRRTRSGRPSLDGIAGRFSLAHSNGHALIGVTRAGMIGVDLELPRRVLMLEPRRAAIEEAGALLDPAMPLPAEQPARFLQAWVRLEAMAKADGRGIGRVLTALGIVRGGTGHGSLQRRVDRLRADLPTLAVHDLAPGSGVLAAVAMERTEGRPTVSPFPHEEREIARLIG